MKFFLLFLGQLAVVSQINADRVQEVLEARTHDITDICNNQANWALLPHSHDCHKFYVCANYVPEEFSCERNYYFDTQAKRCIRGKCSDVTECQAWLRAAADDCHAFEICQNDQYERHVCTAAHYFNAELGMCKPIEFTPQHMCSCILPENSALKHPNKCETYYTCQHGRAVEQKCPRGSYFNSRISACMTDLLGVCVSVATMDPQESAMLEKCERLRSMNSAATAAADNVVFVADSDDCDKFYMCLNGRGVVAKQCPAGFYYDREAKYCAYDAFGVCAAMRVEAQQKADQAEKEAAEKDEDKQQVAEAAIFVKPPPPQQPAHVSLSYTHLKVDADKGNNVAAELRPAQQELPHSHVQADSSVEIMHTADLIMPPFVPEPYPAKISEILKHSKPDKVNENPQQHASKNESFEKFDLKPKLPVVEKLHATTELKVPGNSAYDKLASKFIVF